MSNLSEEEIFRININELRDSYELHNREWAKRCLDTIEDLYNKAQAKLTEYEKQLDLDYVEENYVSKDKIREKIKELDKKAKQELKGIKGQDRYFIKQIYHSKRSFGEELLEEE